MRLWIVLMSDTASAPPRTDAKPGSMMSEMLGVSFAITGRFEASITHPTSSSRTFGS
jgi:hypothetical protein